MVIILFYIGLFSAFGAIIVYLAITFFLKPGMFPIILFSFLLITGLIMMFFCGFILMIYEAKTKPKEKLID